jgi:hypothetical protein
VFACAATLGAIALVPAASAAGSQATVTVPSSIDHDCSRDVGAALTRFFGTVQDDSEVTFPPSACYDIETTVTVTDKSGLTLVGGGTTFKRNKLSPASLRYPNANAMLRFVDLTDSTIKGLNVIATDTGPDESYLPAGTVSWDKQFAFEHGFDFHGARRVTLANSSAAEVWGDGVNISGGDQYTPRRSDGVVVRNVTVAGNGRQGVSVSRASDVLIDHLDVEHSRRSGVDLEPDSANEVISGVEIRDSHVSSWLVAFSSAGPGVVNDVFIHGNTIGHSGVPFVYDRSTVGAHRDSWRVAHNTVNATLSSPLPAMLFANTSNVVVSGNTVPVTTTQSRLAAGLTDGTTGARFSCNWFRGAGSHPVSADAASSFSARADSVGDQPPACLAQPVTTRPVEPTCRSGAVAAGAPGFDRLVEVWGAHPSSFRTRSCADR